VVHGVCRGQFYFSSEDGLWTRNGTAQGTRLLLPQTQEPQLLPDGMLFGCDSGLFFEATDTAHGRELWFSDGTRAGTRLLLDLNPGPALSYYLREASAVAGRAALLAAAPAGVNAGGLILSDGTPAGTMDLAGQSAATRPGWVLESFFDGQRVWVSGGGAPGNGDSGIYVAELKAGSMRKLQLPQWGDLFGRAFFAYGNGVAFVGSNANTGSELWTSDGTAAGTAPLFEWGPGALNGIFAAIRTPSGILAYAQDPAAARTQLLLSDGTLAGTRVLADVAIGPLARWLLSARYFASLPSGAPSRGTFFVGSQSEDDWEPWISDGTRAGTMQLANIALPSPGSSDPGAWLRHGGHAYFAADDGIHGREFWRSEVASLSTTGIGQGQTRKMAEPHPGPKSSVLTSLLPVTTGQAAVGAGRIWWISEASSAAEWSLWSTDGSVLDLAEHFDPVASSKVTPYQLIGTLGAGLVYEGAYSQPSYPMRGYGLYELQGGHARLILDTSSSPFLSRNRTIHAGALWIGHTRPIVAAMHHYAKGTLRAVPEPKGELQTVLGLTGFGPWVFARGLDRDAQPGLWRSDVSATQLQRIGAFEAVALRAVRNRLWMAVRVNGASQLWVGDGQPGQFVSIGNIAVLCDFAGELGDKLIYAPSCSSPGPLFAADPQTRTVERIHPSAEPTRGLLALGARRMLFVASDAQHGSELWITDGTQAGTRLFLETMPGPESAQPELLGQVAGLAYGALDYSSYGREPFVLRYGAGQSDAGRSCGTGGSILFADDPVLGTTMNVQAAFVPVHSLSVLLLGGIEPRPLRLPGGECFAQVDLAQLLAMWLLAPQSGRWSLALPIPNDSQLHGLRFAMQAIHVSPGGSIEATQGLHMALGR
jgi:ELWxxDGT repeat protein